MAVTYVALLLSWLVVTAILFSTHILVRIPTRLLSVPIWASLIIGIAAGMIWLTVIE